MSGPGYNGPPSESRRLRQEAALKDARLAELEAENANFESGARCDRDEIEGLKAELDALRQGCTCANFNGYKQDCNLNLSPCHVHALCHFTPPRWTGRSTP